MAFETNYLGSINLAKVALKLDIPYIHISTAATLPPGENLTEEDHLPLTGDLANYPKSKLMTELTLKHLGETQGLDYTIIRLALVYGKHDHKIQGVHRLLFSIANQSLPLMPTKTGVVITLLTGVRNFPARPIILSTLSPWNWRNSSSASNRNLELKHLKIYLSPMFWPVWEKHGSGGL